MSASVDRIIAATATAFEVSPEELRGASRSRSVARARHVAMALTREITGASYPEIGRAFRRDHSTVLDGVRRVELLVERDARVAGLVDALRVELEGGA